MYEASSKLELAAKQLKQGEDSGDRQSSRKAKPGNPKAGKSKDENAKVERGKSKKKQTASPEKVEAAREKKRSEKRATGTRVADRDRYTGFQTKEEENQTGVL